jgi:hypothetical protein
MICLICTLEPYRIDWLAQFVAHYRAQGVERFLLTLQIDPELPQGDKSRQRARFSETLAQLNVTEAFFWEHVWDGPSMGAHHRVLQETHVGAADWIVWCDSDEFQVYPERLDRIVAQCDGAGVDYIRGVFIDRIAGDGSLPAFDPQRSIWETFPRACNVTGALAQGATEKVTLARGSLRLRGGKHIAPSDATLKTISGWVQVHHFKWDAALIERLRFRVRPEWRARFPWWVESQRLLDYFDAHGQRFDLTDVSPISLQGSHFVAIA